jgi:hypothetical protein
VRLRLFKQLALVGRVRRLRIGSESGSIVEGGSSLVLISRSDSLLRQTLDTLAGALRALMTSSLSGR